MNLTYGQRVVMAVEDVEIGMSIDRSSAKWSVSKSAVASRIAFNGTDKAMDQQQACYESQI